jgi:hypothetical protein
MKIKHLFASAALLGLGFWVASASADVIFTLGSHPAGDELAVVLTNNDTGATIVGEIDDSGVAINYSSLTGQTLTVQGQKIVDDDGNPLTSMFIVVPGYTFGDFILNIPNGTGTATVTAVDNFNDVFSYELGNGQNFLTITTANGESIASISVTMSAGGNFTSFSTHGISQVCAREICIPSGQAPEPQTLALLGFGLLTLVFVRRRRMA